MTPDLELLAPVLGVAVDVARDGESADPPIAAPGSLRPLLRFARLPPAALRTVLAALDDDEFRERVVAATSESAVGRAGWLLVTRPEGWEAEFDELAGGRRRVASEREERRAERVAYRLRADLARSEERSNAHLRELGDLRRRFEEAGHAADRDRREMERLRSELAMAQHERGRAVRELKDTERRLAERVAEVRALRAALAEASAAASGGRDGATSGDDRQAIRHDVGDRLAVLRRGLEETSRGLAALESTFAGWIDDEAAGGGAGVEQSSGRPPAKRRARRLERGLTEDTPEALDWLLTQPGALAVVDGYNVSMLGWPELLATDQRRALERAAGVLHRRTGAAFVLVFDGADVVGSAAPSATAGPGVSVRFTTHDVEADDEILELVEASSAPVIVVVTNDRRVRVGARERGANVARSPDLLALTR